MPDFNGSGMGDADFLAARTRRRGTVLMWRWERGADRLIQVNSPIAICNSCSFSNAQQELLLMAC